jgi:PmbA protein
MEAILKIARKQADAAEVFKVTTDETGAQFEANRLKHVQSRQTSTLAVRVIRNGRIGYAAGTELADPAELVAMAVETAGFGTGAKFSFPDNKTYPNINVHDEEVGATAIETMVSLGENMISPIVAHTADITCEAAVNKAVSTVEIINSANGRVSYRKSVFSAGVEGSLIRGTDMLFVGDSLSACRPLTDTDVITSTVLRQLDLAKETAKVGTGSIPVIFTPDGVASALVEPLMAAFSGKNVLEGSSPIGERRGERVFGPELNLHDDPTLDGRPASRPCDDEGVPSQRTSLIEAGVVSNFYYDLQTAARAGTSSTGHGSRRGGGLPTPSPSAFVIGPGETGLDDMIRGIKEGLVVELLMGAGQGNVLGGDFSGNVLLGYKVENGRIVGRVKDTMVSGNIYRLMQEGMLIGDTARWVGGFLHTPHLCFPAVAVASQ